MTQNTKQTLPALTNRPRPVLLAILDGWGDRSGGEDNAISRAHTPNWDQFVSEFPKGTLDASAEAVGLPEGQMGNSEVGHMNIGAGRVVLQDFPLIDKSIEDGQLQQKETFQTFVAQIKAGSGVCHLMGLCSDGGVHAHQRHIATLAKLLVAEGITVSIHAFTDGRDTPPQSALQFINYLEDTLRDTDGKAKIATVSGRYYAMDRDKRWDRTAKAYETLVKAAGNCAESATAAIEASYANEVHDEFVLPVTIGDYAGMNDGDGILMANFRADRARQILTALLDPTFNEFEKSAQPKFSSTLGMVEYSDKLTPFIPALFPPETISGTLGEVVAEAGLKQLRIAETEKYAHVTFFLNAGREAEYEGEKRILIPSPKVATYDLKPEMSAYEVTGALEEAIASDAYDLIVVNYANPDMVGHTGKMDAAIKAVETVDDCIGRLAKALLPKGGMMFVTADHGNIEQLEDHSTHQPHTAHTLNLVPFLTLYEPWKGNTTTLPEGKLSDIAPTILQVMHLPQPVLMDGESRLKDLLEPTHA